ncbi:hypothetical protein ACXR0O_10775 [Verrucomicrobiota bacterium sgz303538]
MQAPDSTYEMSGAPDVDTLVHRTEEYTREEPLKAVGVAFVAGLFMTMLPVGSIIAGLLRLTLALVRPALLILGAIKLYEEIDRRQNG